MVGVGWLVGTAGTYKYQCSGYGSEGQDVCPDRWLGDAWEGIVEGCRCWCLRHGCVRFTGVKL